jgi:hypothetical protein
MSCRDYAGFTNGLPKKLETSRPGKDQMTTPVQSSQHGDRTIWGKEEIGRWRLAGG